jgi:S1-C subfamily serine protease
VKAQVYIVALVVALLEAESASSQSTSERDGPATIAAIERTLIEVIARAEPSVVAISRSAPQPPPLVVERLDEVFGEFRRSDERGTTPAVVGAGVIIDRAGLVLTEYLTVREGDEHTITTVSGKRYSATIRAADPRSGLAVLAMKLPQQAGQAPNDARDSFPAIRLAENAPIRKGQFVVAIGNPFAIDSSGQPTASWGTVTNLARKAPAGANLNAAPGAYNDYRTTMHHLGTLIQTDAKLGWSSGGGALINLRGEMIGLTTSVAAIAGHEQPAGYAIPTGAAFRRIIDTLKQGREVEYGMIGVSFNQAPFQSPPDAGARLNVAQVYPGSPAARAGLEAGDVITHIGDRTVDDVDAVQLLVSSLPPSTTTTIGYERRGSPGRSTVTLAKLAIAGQPIVTVRPEAWRGIRVDYATALDAEKLKTVIETSAYDPEGCVLVADVERDSYAWRAGVRPGMFIGHVGGKRVTTPDEFRAAVGGIGDRFDIRLTQPIEPALETPATAPEIPP